MVMGRPKLPELINPIEAEKRIAQRMTFSEKYEEDLRKSLFQEDDKKTSEEIFYETKSEYVHHARPNEEWDVPIDEPIEYFDPELSYELTGYRPITMEKGLDFDPTPFKEASITYDKDGCYTKYPKGCKPYADYWKEEVRRCQEGYTVGKYRITGDHYFFINFYRMRTAISGQKSGQGRNESFPSFASKQYEWFHYVEMCEILHKDCVALKGRGVGWSEIAANMAVRPYTTNKKYRTLLTCAAETKLDPLRDKCWMQLNFLDMYTNGGLRHLRQVKNNYELKRASKLTPDGVEFGWMSEIDTIVADTADKVRGDRCDRLMFEEAGSNKNLIKSWIQGDSLVWLGDIKVGTKFAWGTGGDDMALGGLSSIFTNPKAYGVLPYKNYDTDDGKPELVCFFLPSHKFALSSEYVDNRGVTDHIRFKEFYMNKRALLTDQALLDEAAEHCFTPREALNKHGASMFNSVLLTDRLIQLKVQKLGLPAVRTQLLWDKTFGNGMQKVISHESSSSNLFVVEPPVLGEGNVPLKNLYVAGIDAIDQGTNDSATSGDVSDFCVVIYKRIMGTDEPKIVAIYKDRPPNIRIAYDLTMKLLTWYNCKAMLEYTKISIIQYFTDKGKANLFMDRPEIGVGLKGGRKPNSKKRLIGAPGTEPYIKHELELVGNFVDEFWHTIDFIEIVQQLIDYTYENKRKFDIVAALQMAMLGDEALTGVNPGVSNNTASKEWQDIGYYRDENGVLRHGVIPKHNKFLAQWHP